MNRSRPSTRSIPISAGCSRLANILPRGLAQQLQRWVEGGQYAQVFDHVEDTVTLAPFQYVDFEGLDGVPLVLEPLLFYLLHRATATILDPALAGTLKVFVLDEAWRFLRDPTIRAYVTEALKTWRKKNACVLMATQSSEDLQRSELLRVAIESCPTKIFLANPHIDQAVYQELFHLNATEAARIATLVPRQQLLLKQPHVAKVLNLHVDPKSAALFSVAASRLTRVTRVVTSKGDPMVHRWLWRCCCVSSPWPRSRRWRRSPTPAVPRGARTVVYHPRDLVALRAKLHYTTLIVLPEGEDVVEATCGDKEFWIVNVRGGLVSVKPAKAGSETNLNLVTTSGQVYAFLLTEVSAEKGQDADLTVYLEPDDLDGSRPSRRSARSLCPAEQLEDFRAQADLAREQARRATEAARAELDAGLTAFRTTYPLSLQFPYRFKADAKPFFLRAMFHDDHRTFIQSGARELPALYEVKDGKPNLVNFEVHDGTYVIPKVLDDGYLMIGKARMAFRRVDGK